MAEPNGDGATYLYPEWSDVARHPAFETATRRFASNMLRLCDEDARLRLVFKDAGRYVAAMSAAYLHGGGGLTVPLLKQICAASGFLSPGRTEAIIQVLLHLEYLEQGGDRYLPTERFLSAWCNHLKAALDAAGLIDPALARLSIGMDRRETFTAFLAIQAARLHALTQGPDPVPALRRAFLHPHAGTQILWVLTLAENGIAPMATISLSELSRRFGVTHVHVRRLLRRADDEGLIVYHGRGRIAFEAEGLGQIRAFYAFQLSEMIACGRAALAAGSLESSVN